MKPKSLVALRRIEDHMIYSEESFEMIKVSNKMIQSVKEAHFHYQPELAKERPGKEDTQKSFNRKIFTAKIKAVLLATKAEKLLNFEYLKKANQKRRIADDNQRKIKEVEDIEVDLLKKCLNAYLLIFLFISI